MAIVPRKKLCPAENKSWKFPYAMVPEIYVVHNTANDASADNEITYMNRTQAQGGRQTSYHYAIDDKEVVQGLEENVNGWHASDGANGRGNRKGIGIEICYSKSGGDRFIKAEKLAAEFIAQGLKEKGWGLDRVMKHQDFDPNGKYCPHRTLDMGWQRFLNMIASYMGDTTPATTTTTQNTNIAVGDVVQFKGGMHYSSANGASGNTVSAGPAKVTRISEGAKHPYHLVHTDSASTVYGWVDANLVVSENTTTAPNQAASTLYRVRKSKDDAASQVGAYSVLDNAKEACQKAGAGYHVFDSNYNIVYSYVAPAVETPKVETPVETPAETTKPEAVTAAYDLDYKDKVLIVDRTLSRTNKDCTKAIVKILENNKDFDINIAKAFFKLAPKYGIDPMMAIAQSILETGWFKYAGSAVKADQHNYCGLGVTSNGVTGASFATIEDGVTAQLQHLFAYGCKDALPSNEEILDPRFSLVTRGVATYWQQLAGRWAVPGYDKNTYDTPQKAMEAGNTYGQKIRSIYDLLSATNVSDDDEIKYFGKDAPADNTDDTEAKATNIASLIFSVIKKLFQMFTNLFSKGE